MSKVALRVYNREIETLIEQGHVDEAVAHCKHILKTFPKHLETYRLLGKAYLEVQRHDDAVDIFQRVLTSVPDDFVSHLGMSIIADERKDLEQAIWHMERAFEAIPSNGGVQAELRRLYGRRDGLEPPKIQLTRGALARMYIRGGQYAQAVQELKGVLKQEPDRLDLKLLMAQAYFRAGRKVESTEVCNEILKVSPYCFDANRILVEILPGTSLESTLTTYKKRLQQLDPYLAFVTGSTFDLVSVQDMGVTIERLDWDESLSIQAESTWQPEEQPEEQPDTQAEQGSEGESIPDWMKEQGWGSSTGEFQEGPIDFDEPESVSPPGEDLAAAEIPDWLKAMAPSDAEAGVSVSQVESEDADLDWLSGIGEASGVALGDSVQEEPVASDKDVPDWIADLGADVEQPIAELQTESEPSASGEDVPDWLDGLGEETEQPATETQPEAESEDDTSDWLAGLGADVEQPAAEQLTEPEPSASGEDVPDWLAGLGEETEQPATETQPEPISGDDTSDWLAGLGAESAQPSAEAQAESEPAASSEDGPDSLAGLGEEAEQPVAEQQAEPEPDAEAESQDIPDWMADLGTETEQPAIEEQSEPESEQPAEKSQPEPAPVVDGAPAGLVSGPGTTESEQEDAFKWLESLAAGQGEKPEELLTQPEERLDHAPGWMQDVEGTPALSEQQDAESDPEPAVEAEDVTDWMAGLGEETEQPAAELQVETEPESVIESDTPDWLTGVGTEAEKPIAESQPEPELVAEADDVPDWLAGIEEEAESPVSELQAGAEPETQPVPILDEKGDISRLVSGPGTTESEQEEAFKWLESLAAGQGAKPEELLTQPEERLDHAPAWVEGVDDTPSAPATPQKSADFIPEPPIEVEDEELPAELSAPVAGPGTSEPEQDESFKWLESLAAGQGAKPEELLTQPEERLDHVPHWVESVEKPQTELSAPVDGPGTSEAEQDESFKWLENLAAGQGAKPEELLTRPEERLDHSPDWVSQADSQPREIEPVLESQPDEPASASQPESEPTSEDMEDMGVTQWLKSIDGEEMPAAFTEPQPDVEDLPAWLKDESADDLPPEPIPVSEWVPEESQAPFEPTQADSPPPDQGQAEMSETEEATPVAPETEDQAPASFAPTPDAAVEAEQPFTPVPPAESLPSEFPAPPARPIARQTGMLGGDKDAMLLHRSRLLLEKSNLDTAMSEYTRLIKKGKYLEEIIFDLQEATYSHPVDVIIWQTLGDAYMRSNRLQEALDAYTKAEELLR